MESVVWGRRLCAAAIALALAGSTLPAAAQEGRQAVAGTRVSLEVPDGWTKMSGSAFAGFTKEDHGASLIVNLIPAPFALMIEKMTPETLLTRGVVVLAKEEVEVDGRQGVLLHCAQTVQGVEVLKWMLIFGNETRSIMVMGTFPKPLRDDLSEVVKAAVLSARWDVEKKVDPLEGLNYSVDPPDSMKFAGRMGNALTYTKDGEMPVTDPADPLFVVSPGDGVIQPGDRERWAALRIRTTSETKNIKIESNDTIELAGLEGYETVGTGQDADSGEAIAVYQVLLFSDGGYYIMAGIVGAKNRETYLDAFKAFARTFKVR